MSVKQSKERKKAGDKHQSSLVSVLSCLRVVLDLEPIPGTLGREVRIQAGWGSMKTPAHTLIYT